MHLLTSLSRSIATLALLTLLAVPAMAVTHEVAVRSFEFDPPDLIVNVGDTVHWALEGGTHTVTSGSGCTADGEFDSGVLGAPGYDRVFTEPGLVPYFCAVGTHCSGLGMEGIVRVQVPGTSAPSLSGIGFIVAALVAGLGGALALRRRALN